jgi:hypothetical protein
MPEIMLGLSSIDVPTEHLEGSRGHRRSFTRTEPLHEHVEAHDPER